MSRTSVAASFVGSLLGALLLASGPGCGYSTQRLTSGLGGARTLAVLPFENRTFYRDVELRLTQQVAAEIRSRTSFALSSPDRADLLLRGSLTLAQQAVALTPDEDPVVKRVYGSAEITVTDRRSGAVLKRYSVYAMNEFTPDRFGESLEGSAIDEWNRRIAVRVVEGLERGF